MNLNSHLESGILFKVKMCKNTFLEHVTSLWRPDWIPFSCLLKQCVCVCMCVCSHTSLCVCVCAHACLCMCVSVCVHMHVSVSVCTCMFVCLCYMYTFMCVQACVREVVLPEPAVTAVCLPWWLSSSDSLSLSLELTGLDRPGGP